jgi:RNA polymerase sigma-70 factor (ECF subfamily)
MHSNRSITTVEHDAALFTRFRAGDDAAFARLFDRHNRRLFAYCLKITGDEHAACDVMQEVWERIVRLRGSSDPVDNPVGLLLRIVRNLSLNHLRDLRHHLRVDELSATDHPSDEPHEPTYVEELVVMALDRLPIQQREVIILHAYSGYEYTEIARMLEMPVDNVRMRAMRGRAHLARVVSALVAVEDARVRSMDSDEHTRPEVRS